MNQKPVDDKPITVTFDKKSRNFVWQAIKESIEDRTSPFCGKKIDGRNFAGAIHYKGEPRAIDGCIICLMGVAKNVK